MMWLDLAGAVCILLGACLSCVAAIGLHRLSDPLGRLHAASKPQTLGIALAALGLALVLRDPVASGMLVLVGALQLLTAPVASQMMARSAYRTRQYRRDLLLVADDEPDAGTSDADGPDEPAGDAQDGDAGGRDVTT